MGYDVSIELADATLREAYEKAAKRLDIEHSVRTWGDREPSEWETRCLWEGGSFARDLAEYLQSRGRRIETGKDDYCQSYAISPDVLVSLGKIHGEMAVAMIGQLTILENLGLVSDEDAFDYWNALERGIESVTTEYLSVPVPRAVSLPDFHGAIVRNDRSAPASHADQKAWDAYVTYLGACRALSDAKRDGDKESIKFLEAERDEAERAYDAVRPQQDTVTAHGGRMEIDTYDHSMSVEREVRNPMAGAAFKSSIISIIRRAVGDDYYVSDIYQILSEHPGLMPATFGRLGEIGMAAKEAGIEELIVNPSW